MLVASQFERPFIFKGDITCTAQLFPREVNSEFKVTQELASVNSLHGRTTERIFLKNLREHQFSQCKMKWNLLCYN